LAYTNLERNLPQKAIETEQHKQSANIINYAWHMKKNGRAEITIQTTIAHLTRLNKLCNIYEPEQVKTTIAIQTWKNNSKRNLAQIYNGYLKYIGKTWEQPKYTHESGLPFIPTEQELDTLIAMGKQRTATLLQMLKETGARIGEMRTLQWIHIDLERKTVYITAEKGSNSRILPISTKLIAMLNQIPHDNQTVFPTSTHGLQVTIDKLKRKASKKLNNPRLLQIHPHTFRHWKGTTEYHKTKDIMHVKAILGHKNISSTMVYINLENAIFLEQNDEFTCKVAKTPDEAIKLIEAGFTKADEIDGIHIYKKRK
jgi:integrase